MLDYDRCIELGFWSQCINGWGGPHPGGVHFGVADGAVRWIATLPEHVNIDRLVIRPRAQASNWKVARSS